SPRAPFRTQEPQPAFAPTHLLCPSTPEVSDRSAEARQNPPAIYLHRQKAVSGPTCRSRGLQRELVFAWKPFRKKINLETRKPRKDLINPAYEFLDSWIPDQL